MVIMMMTTMNVHVYDHDYLMVMVMILMMIIIINVHDYDCHDVVVNDDDVDDDYMHFDIPLLVNFNNLQPFHDSGAEQRQGCTEIV